MVPAASPEVFCMCGVHREDRNGEALGFAQPRGFRIGKEHPGIPSPDQWKRSDGR